uniref:uncharacterized protein LOC120337515 n=1 Tax=Styela clava TaxID=7725 RepID=UPI00193A94A1|nr:uncharacterized protein LOC120337515 [Styela clava]
MFNLLAQYIGYGTEVGTTDVSEPNDGVNCSFGETEEGEWTLVEVKDGNKHVAEEFHRVPSPSPLESLSSSMIEEEPDVDVVEVPVGPSVAAVIQDSRKRMRCTKTSKRQRTNASSFSQHRPNQMKRANQVLCQRSNKVYQKMRQIVHQPRKY